MKRKNLLDKEEFLARLRDGEDAESLGQIIADEMNEVLDEYHNAITLRKDARDIVDRLIYFLTGEPKNAANDPDRESMTDFLIKMRDLPAENVKDDNDALLKWLKSPE